MGMTPEQYWEMSPYLAVAYRKAYKLRREADNEQAWLQGLYIHVAFAVALSNAFAKSGARKLNYTERPLDIFPLTEEQKKLREQQEMAKMQQAMEEMARRQRRENKRGG